MLVATVEFLLGTYRADPDGAAHTGRLERGEWPPAPSRLFDALVAADGTRDRCRHTDGSELEFLENAGAPLIDAALDVHHEPLLPRFVASWSHKFDQDPKTREVVVHQEYLGRRGSEIRQECDCLRSRGRSATCGTPTSAVPIYGVSGSGLRASATWGARTRRCACASR